MSADFFLLCWQILKGLSSTDAKADQSFAARGGDLTALARVCIYYYLHEHPRCRGPVSVVSCAFLTSIFLDINGPSFEGLADRLVNGAGSMGTFGFLSVQAEYWIRPTLPMCHPQSSAQKPSTLRVLRVC
jgi:hypothetical protein